MFTILHIDSTSDKGKSIFRPFKIRRGLVHGPHFESDYLSKYSEIQLGFGEMFSIHLRDSTNSTKWFELKSNNLYKSPQNFEKVQRSFERKMNSNAIVKEAYSTLPTLKPFFEAALQCAEETYRQKHTKDMCMTPLDCDYKITNSIPCVVMKPKFKRFDNGKGVVLHMATRKEFVDRSDCSLIY
ncbi:unnamed protein product [Bursaphelenchus okinawaensis]|uniref:Uncharacterized protein n=1 Tax=Bursaphelenchus okinawaensis TaxID=465554 RepID=A0A811JQ01_9BILA|nr:unnamed protein product [Bursaphelenchus okinawaensis]CAG9077292.1 unnamed protein product [Bursaphelenchus okinawaensis]